MSISSPSVSGALEKVEWGVKMAGVVRMGSWIWELARLRMWTVETWWESQKMRSTVLLLVSCLLVLVLDCCLLVVGCGLLAVGCCSLVVVVVVVVVCGLCLWLWLWLLLLLVLLLLLLVLLLLLLLLWWWWWWCCWCWCWWTSSDEALPSLFPFIWYYHVLPQIMARWKRMLSVKDAHFLCPFTAGPASRRCAQAECEPEHGRADQGRRRFPLLVKDVAGLVPGAGRPKAYLSGWGWDSLTQASQNVSVTCHYPRSRVCELGFH